MEYRPTLYIYYSNNVVGNCNNLDWEQISSRYFGTVLIKKN